jgi:hypothetical protein
MNKASPVELRKAMIACDALVKAGIDFIPVPVIDQDHKVDLAKQAEQTLNAIMKQIEG